MRLFHVSLLAILTSMAAAEEVAQQPNCLFCIPGTVEEWKPSCKACLAGEKTTLEVRFFLPSDSFSLQILRLYTS